MDANEETMDATDFIGRVRLADGARPIGNPGRPEIIDHMTEVNVADARYEWNGPTTANETYTAVVRDQEIDRHATRYVNTTFHWTPPTDIGDYIITTSEGTQDIKKNRIIKKKPYYVERLIHSDSLKEFEADANRMIDQFIEKYHIDPNTLICNIDKYKYESQHAKPKLKLEVVMGKSMMVYLK